MAGILSRLLRAPGTQPGEERFQTPPTFDSTNAKYTESADDLGEMPPSGVIEPQQPYLNRRLPGGAPASLPAARPMPAPMGAATGGMPAMPSASAAAPSLRPAGPGGQLQEAQNVWEQGYQKPQGIGGRLRNTLGALGRGAVQGLGNGEGIVPGALRQGILGAADPRAERKLQFEQQIRPQIEQRLGREAADAAYNRQQQQQGMADEMERAKLANVQSETQARLGGIKDQDLVRRKTEAEISLSQAREQAALRGTPQRQDLELEDGQIHSILVYPDGSQVDIGASGRAATEKQNRLSREKVAGQTNATRLKTAGMQQSGAYGRAQMEEEGRDRRTGIQQEGMDRRVNKGRGLKTGAGQKVATRADIQEAMKLPVNQGKSEADVRRQFEAHGWRFE